ncbi:MAG TPA: hypothetical protein VF047_07275, partial [Nitrososphaeraceae archaeon]
MNSSLPSNSSSGSSNSNSSSSSSNNGSGAGSGSGGSGGGSINNTSLKVLEAYTRDVGRGIARIDYDTMD